MSARKVDGAGPLQQNVTVEGRQSRLSLSADAVVLSQNGIEFRSPSPFAAWTEMTVSLQSPRGDGRINCNGVVISCSGNRHTGYHVSMVFTNLTKQAQARLSLWAFSQLG
jgi:PilZ domain-containing protein